MKQHVKCLVFVLVLLCVSGVVGAYSAWDTPSEDCCVHELDAILRELADSLARAVESKAAHPDFLTDLQGILQELHRWRWDWELRCLKDSSYEVSIPQVGDRISHTVGAATFYMRLAPAATYPTVHARTTTVDNSFWIAETEVTYELWYHVKTWAMSNGYRFENEGREGSHGDVGQHPSASRQEPVTTVSWRNTVLWCNALSEYLGFEPVYTYNGRTVREPPQPPLSRVEQEDRNGFRLPTAGEWRLAGRYQGSDDSGNALEYPEGSGTYWTNRDFSSGAYAGNKAASEAVAWTLSNSEGKTHAVGLKKMNALGLYDMSGNVWEFTFTISGSGRASYGGAWDQGYMAAKVSSQHLTNSLGPTNNIGFRIVRTERF